MAHARKLKAKNPMKGRDYSNTGGRSANSFTLVHFCLTSCHIVKVPSLHIQYIKENCLAKEAGLTIPIIQQ